ncbi:N-formylglutamate amidohydrolase [Erythrobacter mangrovi]|uniref:N-formylglutamate amidohydrolase n=1 Tax=Erythrobacter mangrovi TaxID=2739433 RepID=A0A7D4CN77_9SPHN|nr:N-formylglutamate amidohydrolase [Erythrobacter mangrovi]QKG71848.1 N-formylglutamate amidohydrolase [Erythrobacter mangrovi]
MVERDTEGHGSGVLIAREHGFQPFKASGLEDSASPIVIAAPHGGRDYGPDVLAAMRDPDGTRLRLEDRYVDLLAEAVAEQCGAAVIVARVPRAVIDLNRAPDDVDWGMISGSRPKSARHSLSNRRARSGLGIIPRRLPGSGEIWRGPVAVEDLERRIATVHRPYHAHVAATLEAMRDRWGAALLVDLHSMPPLRKRIADEVPAEFVIGDRFGASCGHHLIANALRHLGERGRGVAHNRPYSGGYVLDRHGFPARGIHAMQVEVCRSTYLCANLEEPSARFQSVVKLLAGLMRALADEVAFFGRERMLPNAAE